MADERILRVREHDVALALRAREDLQELLADGHGPPPDAPAIASIAPRNATSGVPRQGGASSTSTSCSRRPRSSTRCRSAKRPSTSTASNRARLHQVFLRRHDRASAWRGGLADALEVAGSRRDGDRESAGARRTSHAEPRPGSAQKRSRPVRRPATATTPRRGGVAQVVHRDAAVAMRRPSPSARRGRRTTGIAGRRGRQAPARADSSPSASTARARASARAGSRSGPAGRSRSGSPSAGTSTRSASRAGERAVLEAVVEDERVAAEAGRRQARRRRPGARP